MIPSDMVLGLIFQKFDPTDVPFNESFHRLGYENHNLVLNMENSFPILIFNLVFTAILIGISKCVPTKSEREILKLNCLKRLIYKTYFKVHKAVVYNLMIRFFIQSYMEFTLITFVSLYRLRYFYVSDIVGSFMTYIFMMFLIPMPLILYFFAAKFHKRYHL
jgi:hypothetical protein